MSSTPLADAVRAAIDAAKAAEQIWIDDDSCPNGHGASGSCGCASLAASLAADHALDVARTALRASDEARTYEIRDESGSWEIESCPSTLDDDVAESVRDGDWGDDRGAWWWHGYVSCEADGYSDRHTVEMSAAEPDCSSSEHDWESPHEVVGGCEENPGVQGRGGGVIIREVCAHCGAYRITDTWAQDRDTGEQGLHSVDYEPADDDSLAWVAARPRQEHNDDT